MREYYRAGEEWHLGHHRAGPTWLFFIQVNFATQSTGCVDMPHNIVFNHVLLSLIHSFIHLSIHPSTQWMCFTLCPQWVMEIQRWVSCPWKTSASCLNFCHPLWDLVLLFLPSLGHFFPIPFWRGSLLGFPGFSYPWRHGPNYISSFKMFLTTPAHSDPASLISLHLWLVLLSISFYSLMRVSWRINEWMYACMNKGSVLCLDSVSIS